MKNRQDYIDVVLATGDLAAFEEVEKLSDKDLESYVLEMQSTTIQSLLSRVKKLEEKVFGKGSEGIKSSLVIIDTGNEKKSLLDDFKGYLANGDSDKKLSSKFNEQELIDILSFLGIFATKKGSKADKIILIKKSL